MVEDEVAMRPDETAQPELPAGFSVGDELCVDGEKGEFRVRGVSSDGSLTVVGGPRKVFRAFRPEWCYPVTSIGKGGRKVKGRLPPERRGLREAWRAEHGLERVVKEPGSPPAVEDDEEESHGSV